MLIELELLARRRVFWLEGRRLPAILDWEATEARRWIILFVWTFSTGVGVGVRLRKAAAAAADERLDEDG